jgi:ABC-2 type transport system ATP-binding protein
MIKIINVNKSFGKVKSLDNIRAEIPDGSIFGIIGSNGAGKSTLLRIIAGIYSADIGCVQCDGVNVWENPKIKEEIIYISDEQYFMPHSTIDGMMKLYSEIYRNFDSDYCRKLCDIFHLEKDRKINTFSKGMQKQASIILSIAAKPRYLLCDETFDGLDPVMRQLVKRILADKVAAGEITPIIASHNLRELEDICDHIGLLHKGGILFESEIDSLKDNMHTVQLVSSDETAESLVSALSPVSIKHRGSMWTLVVRGSEGEISSCLRDSECVFHEIIPMTLEEIFISEMEERGYDYAQMLL